MDFLQPTKLLMMNRQWVQINYLVCQHYSNVVCVYKNTPWIELMKWDEMKRILDLELDFEFEREFELEFKFECELEKERKGKREWKKKSCHRCSHIQSDRTVTPIICIMWMIRSYARRSNKLVRLVATKTKLQLQLECLLIYSPSSIGSIGSIGSISVLGCVHLKLNVLKMKKTNEIICMRCCIMEELSLLKTWLNWQQVDRKRDRERELLE